LRDLEGLAADKRFDAADCALPTECVSFGHQRSISAVKASKARRASQRTTMDFSGIR
jgi:hypothetical protein